MSSAPSEEATNHDDEGESKGKGKLKLIILILAVLVIVGGGVGLYMSGILFSKSTPAEAAEGADAAHAAATEPAAHPDAAHAGSGQTASGGATAPVGSSVFYDLPDFLVNLNTGTNKSSFLKVSVTLELANAEGVPQVEAMKPRIVDSFQTYLRELRPGDLKGSAGIYRLREELLLRVNKTVQPAQVNDILFREMIVQ